MKVINNFHGEHGFLSNFCPAEVVLDGVKYPSVEHAYQAAKTLNTTERKQFENGTPGNAKRQGRSVTLRPNWKYVKIYIMERLLRQKFSQPPLRRLLLATGDDTLVEGNNWGDTYWGVCRGTGDNHLGKLLMKIRYELKQENYHG